MKKSFLFLSVFIILVGCTSTVSYKLSRQYYIQTPRTIAVLPVGGVEAEADGRYLMRTIVAEKLRLKGYKTLSLEEVDERFLTIGLSALEKMPPQEIADFFQADAILFIWITEWDRDTLITYASMDIAARFELFSKGGVKLWRADYAIKESDIKLDRTQMKLAVLKAYEPKVQRLVDVVFNTLPHAPAEAMKKEDKSFFNWLPSK
ncbi:MAG: DUF799 family lipoprotein [Deltaproteobacteria bacterium]|nr:DUF799 family lipoprotein [Deltaproteobacteria bacterium]